MLVRRSGLSYVAKVKLSGLGNLDASSQPQSAGKRREKSKDKRAERQYSVQFGDAALRRSHQIASVMEYHPHQLSCPLKEKPLPPFNFKSTGFCCVFCPWLKFLSRMGRLVLQQRNQQRLTAFKPCYLGAWSDDQFGPKIEGVVSLMAPICQCQSGSHPSLTPPLGSTLVSNSRNVSSSTPNLCL